MSFRVPKQALLSRFQKLLAPPIVDTLADPFPSAQLGRRLCTKQRRSGSSPPLIPLAPIPIDIANGVSLSSLPGFPCHRFIPPEPLQSKGNNSSISGYRSVPQFLTLHSCAPVLKPDLKPAITYRGQTRINNLHYHKYISMMQDLTVVFPRIDLSGHRVAAAGVNTLHSVCLLFPFNEWSLRRLRVQNYELVQLLLLIQ